MNLGRRSQGEGVLRRFLGFKDGEALQECAAGYPGAAVGQQHGRRRSIR